MKLFPILLLALQLTLTAANLSFHRNYMDHAVLQRDRPIEISGLATPGKEVHLVIEPTSLDYP